MRTLRVAITVGAILAATPPLWAQTEYTAHKLPTEPTAAEQYVLELINRARANPTAEGTRLGIVITEGLTAGEVADTGPRPPLAMNGILMQIARAHSLDMWTRDYFDHDDMPPVGSAPDHMPSDRATAAGYNWTLIGENIATSTSATAAQLEDYLMVDGPPPYPGRGHRKNLLDINAGSSTYFREIGLGYYSGTSSKTNIYRDVITEDFGRSPTGPFLVGVVYNDTNGNSFYDIGEEMAGVTINLSPVGTWKAVTGTAGGYAFPVGTSGTIMVTATGGAFGASVVTKAVVLTGENVKVDFKLSDLAIVDTDGDGLPDSWEMANFLSLAQTAGGDFDGDGFSNLAEFNAGSDPKNALSVPGDVDGDGLPDAWETANFGNLAQTAAGDFDGDGFSNLAEFNAGSDPKNALSIPGAITPPATKKGGGGGGGCGLTGLDVICLLALLRLGRRIRRA
jgi:hypothetical protein